MTILLRLGLAIYSFIYFFLKLLPTKNKIVFISRQDNEPSLDFQMIIDEVNRQDPDCETVCLCKKIEGNIFNKIGYCFHIVRQAYHIATSRIVILDSFCILASCMKHKKSLLIVQIWHSVGTMKRSGVSIIDKEEGSERKLAEVMHMHEQYDYALCSSEAYEEDLAACFGMDLDRMVVLPLPRTQCLRNKEFGDNTRRKVIDRYPVLDNGKENIVYCPTFRVNEEEEDISAVKELIREVDLDKYNLIFKKHPLSKVVIKDETVIVDNEFTTFDMLFVADKVISDFSCIIYEAAVLGAPIYLYAYDLEEYSENRGLFIDYENVMPGPVFKDAKELNTILSEEYDYGRVKEFADKYVVDSNQKETYNIVKFIFEESRKKEEETN